MNPAILRNLHKWLTDQSTPFLVLGNQKSRNND